MTARLATAAGLAIWLLAVAGHAQQAVFRSQIEWVRVDVAVNRGGKPVAGLGPEDFDLRDNAVRQTVQRVLVEKVPIDVMLVLDASTSVVGRRLEHLQEAATRLLAGLRPGDRAGLITFTQRVTRQQPLTTDLKAVAAGVERIKGLGSTALHDAIFAGLLQPPAADRRTVLVLFSDGLDNMSWLSSKQLLETAKRSSAIVYAVAETNPSTPTQTISVARALLEGLTGDTGGRVWWVPDPDQFREAFTQILQDITTRYVLLYQPEGVSDDGWHTLTVKLTRARGDVTARPGYFRK
jgi:VWFA-related protein